MKLSSRVLKGIEKLERETRIIEYPRIYSPIAKLARKLLKGKDFYSLLGSYRNNSKIGESFLEYCDRVLESTIEKEFLKNTLEEVGTIEYNVEELYSL